MSDLIREALEQAQSVMADAMLRGPDEDSVAALYALCMRLGHALEAAEKVCEEARRVRMKIDLEYVSDCALHVDTPAGPVTWGEPQDYPAELIAMCEALDAWEKTR